MYIICRYINLFSESGDKSIFLKPTVCWKSTSDSLIKKDLSKHFVFFFQCRIIGLVFFSCMVFTSVVCGKVKTSNKTHLCLNN